MKKPKIYAFSNIKDGSEGMAYAMAEDGTILGSHFCSHECYVSNDLGVNKGSRLDRHEDYKKHYPNGYKMEFIPVSKTKKHNGLQLAIKLNKEQGKKAKAEKARAEKCKKPV